MGGGMSFSSAEVSAAIVAGIVSLIGFIITYYTAIRRERVDKQIEELKDLLENKELHAAEAVARRLMEDKEWPLRSFRIIKHHLGGFEDNELRKILVRAGAVRFTSEDDVEIWGLLEKNRHLLGAEKIPIVVGKMVRKQPGFPDIIVDATELRHNA
jgi:hypothetical protein